MRGFDGVANSMRLEDHVVNADAARDTRDELNAAEQANTAVASRYAAATVNPVALAIRRIAPAAGPGMCRMGLATGASLTGRACWEVRCQPLQSEQL